MKLSVNNIDPCLPVIELLELLSDAGYKIVESRVGDIHFNELYFLLKSGRNKIDTQSINIDKIKPVSSDKFNCECHWSIIEIKE